MSKTDAKRTVGTCLSWIRDFGFLETPNTNGIFCHYTSIDKKPGEYAVLVPGEEYTFILKQGPKGPIALNVKKIGDDYAYADSHRSEIR